MVFDINKKAFNLVLSFFQSNSSNKKALSESENGVSEIIHDIKTPAAAQIRACELLLNGTFGQLENKQKEIILSVINSNKYILN